MFSKPADDAATAKRLLAEIIRDARDLTDLLSRTTIRHNATGSAYYLRNIEDAFRGMAAAHREAYRMANTPQR